ncbi:MAG: hypothetical protein WB992_06795, partial [Bryobacteraceae bacterium]
MSKKVVVTSRDLRKKAFTEAKSEIAAELDAQIGAIHVGTHLDAVTKVEEAIKHGAAGVEILATDHMYGDFQEALADTVASVTHLNKLEKRKDDAEKKLDALPVSSLVHLVLALCYIGAFIVAFFTELKLTDAMVDLLGYRNDDPTGKAIGAAFASSMLVFDLIFTRLGLVSDPWPLFGFGADRDTEGDPSRPWIGGRFTALGGIAIMLTLIGVGVLQGIAVVKMAPTRPIDAAVQHFHRDLTDAENRIVEDSALFFSVCVLISGGYMAAAGTRELSMWSERRRLIALIAAADRESRIVNHELDKTEKPLLAGALETAGIPCLWLSTASHQDLVDRLAALTGLVNGVPASAPDGIRRAAAAEGTVFGSGKHLALSRARLKPAPPLATPRRSWR